MKQKLNKISKINLWKKFWGSKFKIVRIKKGLNDDEILIYHHTIYVKKGD